MHRLFSECVTWLSAGAEAGLRQWQPAREVQGTVIISAPQLVSLLLRVPSSSLHLSLLAMHYSTYYGESCIQHLLIDIHSITEHLKKHWQTDTILADGPTSGLVAVQSPPDLFVSARTSKSFVVLCGFLNFKPWSYELVCGTRAVND